MEKMKDLKDLLTHEIQDLYSAEEQIIKAMPLMIEKAKNAELTRALKEHLRITEEQKNRLDEVKKMMKESASELPGVEQENNGQEGEEKKGFLSGLFGSGGSQVCRGMMGLIEEGQKVMNEDMSPEVLDAAIIACAQKIEHYEICGYGTARAYARELNLREVATLLEQTLEEEYTADDLLTELAVGKLNEVAEGKRPRGGQRNRGGSSSSGNRGGGSGNRSKAAKKAAPKKAAPRKAASKKSAPAKKAAPKKAAAKKGAAKKGASKSGSSSRGRSKAAKSASTRNVKSPGGRAGTSHRGPRGR